ncbi:hypothetical protein J2Z48_003076 [Croceifilum oryzae]|uniref:DUF3888 domain-containing protein n=1 Tax=Croceifilum oryzae TaxID=1553429 RepID=A0AAJ1WVC0_9BACL|nr:DUF3888 domain-containing protein [Croceifilum oryzae]MDQ0418871.1 hypothetical protein [Croceifilum oryzae]
MKHKFILYILCCLMLFTTTGFSHPSQIPNQEYLHERALIGTLSPSIYNAIAGYYGSTKLFDSEKMISVEQSPAGSNIYIVKVQVTTFEGPQNPPYGIETVTLRVGFQGITVINFQHRDKA